MRMADDEKLDEAVYLWFVQKRSQDFPVSGPILCEKAVQLHAQLHQGDSEAELLFQASRGWLWRFCQRHGIRQLSLQGEKISADASAVEPFQDELQELLESEQLTLDQLYNCDETGLNYRMLPNKTLAGRSEKDASAMKKQKERVTWMSCSNATGMHKLPLVLIGKSLNPRCFKNINKKALPVQYCAQKNVWMNSPIFSDWFHQQFVPAVTKYQNEKGLTGKALLLLDNAPSHPDVTTLCSQDGTIRAMYFPPNTTALFQPMDQGVLEAMKRRYHKALLQKLLLEDREGRSIIEFVKKIDMKDVVYMAAAAWEDVPPSTLVKSWKKLLRTENSAEQSTSTTESEKDSDEVLQLAQQLDSNIQLEDVNEWVNVKSNDQGYQLLSDEDIVRKVSQTDNTEVTEEESGDESEDVHVPSSGEVKDMLNKCLLWYERQEECTATSLLLLKRVRDLAASKRFANLKQLTLDSFLNL